MDTFLQKLILMQKEEVQYPSLTKQKNQLYLLEQDKSMMILKNLVRII